MDTIDRQLLDLMQSAFPATEQPYAALGKQVGIDEDEVLRRVRSMQEQGLVRRIGVSVSPQALGWTTTLVAARVSAEQYERVTKLVNAYDEVTHNYERAGAYNMWFTLIAPDRERIERITGSLRHEEGVESVIELPATDVYKLKVRFRTGDQHA